MAWTYSATSLGTSTSGERLNSVRYLVGDTDTSDQQVQDEEITFALSQTGDNIYYAASFVAENIAALYSRRVDTDLDGALSEKYSNLSDQYRKLSAKLGEMGKRYGGTSLGISFGGILVADVNSIRDDGNRVTPSFSMDRFRHPEDDYQQTNYVKE